MLRVFIISIVLAFLVNKVTNAQVLFSSTVEIQELQDSTYTDYPVLFQMNTADLVANGYMVTVNDIFFSTDCNMTDTVPYYIEPATFNTANTKVWIRVPVIYGHTVNRIYYFIGDQLGSSAEGNVFNTLNFQTFNGGGPVNVPNNNPFRDRILITNGTTVMPFSDGLPIIFSAYRIIIDNGGTINANGRGSAGGGIGGLPGMCTEVNCGGDGSNTTRVGAGGGAYGGNGGDGGSFGAVASGGTAFGTAAGDDPGIPGIGAGGGGGVNVTGGNGGGGIILMAQDIQINNAAMLSANGNDGQEDVIDSLGTGGGSGGGILVRGRYVDIANATFSAAGGNGGSDSGGVDSLGAGGGGSGGRMKVFYYENGTLTALTVDSTGGLGGNGGTSGVDGNPGDDGTFRFMKRPDLRPFIVQVNPIISVQKPVVNGADTACQGSTQTYTATVIPGNAYQWQVNGGSISGDSTTNQVEVTFNTAGTDSVILITTNIFLGCSDTVVQEVFVNDTSAFSVNFTFTGQCNSSPTQFTDASSGSIVAYFWDFGDGNTSNTKNPFHVYTASGDYSVTLSVTSDFGCVKSATQTVTIDSIPVVDFSGDTACVGQPTTFTDLSSGTPPLSYSWNYGDGTSGSSFSHTYNSGGTFGATLTVTSTLGCSNFLQKTVIVNSLPNPDFSFISACADSNVSFTDLSTPSGSISAWSWDFTNGSSNLQNPSNSYAAPGTYNVTLTVTAGGCADSVTKAVEVFPNPTASFTATSVCDGQETKFNNASVIASGTLSYSWDFDNDNSEDSNEKNPSYSFSGAGSYPVTLTATSDKGCSSSVTSPAVVLLQPIPGVQVDPVCFGDSTRVIDLSTNLDAGAYYEVDFFNDSVGPFPGGYSTPHISPGDTSILIQIVGVYPTKVRVTNGNGCRDSIIGNITVYPTPIASFTAPDVCFGEGLQFSNNTIIPTGPVAGYPFPQSPVFQMHPSTQDSFLTAYQTLNYLWDLGNGATSNALNPSDPYGAAGTYPVSLTVTSDNGCTDTYTDTVTVNAQPVPNFVVDPVCFGDSTHVTDHSTGLDAGAYYEIDFYSDGFYDAGPFSAPKDTTVLIPIVGVYDATLRVTNGNGCKDSISGLITIYPQPIADFEADSVCVTEALQFSNTTIVPANGPVPGHPFPQAPAYPMHISTKDSFLTEYPTLSYLWDFGDGDTNNILNPAHNYSVAGIDTVTLTVVSQHGCSASTSKSVIVYPQPVANFSFGVACYDKGVTFSNLSTISFGTMTYFWDFGDDSTSTDSIPTHVYTTIGVYHVTLTVTSDKGCMDVVTKDVIVYPNPTANFIVDNVCDQDTAHFFNLSSSPNNTPAGTLTYVWDFGDLTSVSVDEEPSHVFPQDGNFTVQLVAATPFGCTDTIPRTVTIYPLPSVNFTYSPSPNVCFGEEIDFKNSSSITSGVLVNNFWDFGDGDVSAQLNPSHTYANDSTYLVTLTVTSGKGCVASDSQAVVVRPLPTGGIIPLGPTEFCFGDFVILSGPPSPQGQGYTYVWSTGDSTQNIKVDATGEYCVTVTTAFGCDSSFCDSVTVWPLPPVYAWPDTTISKGFSVQLHACCGVSYAWSPDKDLDDPFTAEPVATPLETTTYTVTVTDARGCTDSSHVADDTSFVVVTVLNDYLVKPYNLITPNNDGYNEKWEVVNILTYPDAEVLIFDRWGTLVFSKKSYDNSWDGTNDGKDLPEGTYYYVIRFDGADKVYKGAVSILR